MRIPRSTGFWGRLGVFTVLVCFSSSIALSQTPASSNSGAFYSTGAGQTSIWGTYDPHQAPVAKAPGSIAPGASMPPLPTIPPDQYQANKAAIGAFVQSTFALPPAIEHSSPLPRAPGSFASIVSTPTSSWQGIQVPVASQQQPPSPDLAVGPSDVLMVINSAIAQFTKSGTLVTQTAFTDWFASVIPNVCPIVTGCLVYDPIIRYDQLHGRFLFMATSRSSDFRNAYLLISVSNGATYNSGWKIFALNAALDGSTLTPNWADFWRLGFDNVAVYLAGNMYAGAGSFQYAKIRVVTKAELYNPATTTLHYQDLFNLKNADGTLADSLTPVHQRGIPSAANAALLVNSTTIKTPASFLTVWKINDPLANPLTTTQSTVTGLWPYSFPAAAPQAFVASTLDTSDSRMLKAIYRSGFLYTARDTGYPEQSTTVTFDVIDTSSMKMSSQARLINTNSFYPAFDVPASNPAGVPFVTANAITGTTTASDGTLTYPGISNLKAGEGTFTLGPSPNRWGDYFGGAIDPITGGLWVSGQYSKPSAPGGFGQWGTWAGYFPWSTTPVFSDVPSTSGFSDYINVLSLWQITTGCSASPPMFCPAQLVTRAQLATFIVRAMLGDKFLFTTTPYFTDVATNNVFFPYIQKMRDLGITTGCTATTFCPDAPVTRGDAAVFFVRGKLASLFGDKFTYPTTAFFTDMPSTDVRFPFVQKMSELGITSGCSATLFCPASQLTRQEVAVFLIRAFLN